MSEMLANHDIERATLAVIVAHGGAEAVEQLSPGHFDATPNRTIFEAIVALRAARKPIDEPNLSAYLVRMGKLADAGGKAGLGALFYHDTALRSNLGSYVADLRDAFHRRTLAQTLASLAKQAETSTDDLPVLVERIEREILGHTRKAGGEGHFVDGSEMVTDALDLIEQARNRGDGLVGLDTGINELNDLLGGWEAGTFTVLMGTPGVGKTALWLQSALHVAQSSPVALVELEMTPAKMGLRALSNSSQVSFRQIRRGSELSDRDWRRLSESAGALAGRNVMIAPAGISEWSDIKAWYRRMHLDHGARSLWVDNIKIIGMKGAKDLDRLQLITRQLKLLAIELNIPVIAIHHMHRLEDGKRPSLTSGYGSSSIEQDADNILALWRMDETVDDVQVLPLKTRDDLARPATLQWHGDQQRYSSIVGDTPIDHPEPLYSS